jgi:hypothetical protein
VLDGAKRMSSTWLRTRDAGYCQDAQMIAKPESLRAPIVGGQHHLGPGLKDSNALVAGALLTPGQQFRAQFLRTLAPTSADGI